MKVKTATWSPDSKCPEVERFLDRPAIDAVIEEQARGVLNDIRKNGDRAVLRYVHQFDCPSLRKDELRITAEELRAVRRDIDPAFRRAARETRKRVTAFARAGMRKDWRMKTPGGGMLGEQMSPIDRVGVYVPGGTAPLVSTVLMSVPMATVAGVPEIVACTPPARDGSVNPFLLYALDLAGVTEIYRVGGIPAIGMMAYGTPSVRKVDKVVGPGGAYVTAAKKLVYGDVALDLVAGPSEVAILADSSASPRHIAADLLAQAEHGTGAEKALLVTTSKRLLSAVTRELDRQIKTLSRKKLIAPIIKNGTLLVTVKNLEQGMALCNAFAPEHFELLVRNPQQWVKRTRHAGAIFVGPWTPEVAGDFVAGPSHVLPTGGAARMFSGLTVDDFRKRSSVIRFTRRDLAETLPTIEAFGRVEGLDAHARSASIRFDKS